MKLALIVKFQILVPFKGDTRAFSLYTYNATLLHCMRPKIVVVTQGQCRLEFFLYKAVRLHGLKDYSPHAIEQCRIACARKSSRAPLALMDNFSYGVIL